MAPPFAYDVAVLKITVAALMTTEWIGRTARRCRRTRIWSSFPGSVRRRSAVLASKVGVPVEKGRRTCARFPTHFGRVAVGARLRRLRHRDPGRDQQRAAAVAPRAAGGGRRVPRGRGRHHRHRLHAGPSVSRSRPTSSRELVAAGMRVSIDSFDAQRDSHRGRRRRRAGAEREPLEPRRGRLTLAGSGARVVAVPELGGSLDTLEPTLAALDASGVPYLIDPILEPIGHGFMASLERYAEVRRRYPDAEMLHGRRQPDRAHRRRDSTGVNAHADRHLPGAGRAQRARRPR